MPKQVHLICGVPGSGKTWVAKQLKQYNYKPHDSYPVNEYHKHIIDAANSPDNKPVLAEAPFRISVLIDLLKSQGIPVKTYYISEPEQTIRNRYETRDGKSYPKQHTTNLKKYDARDWDERGTSEQVLDILNKETK